MNKTLLLLLALTAVSASSGSAQEVADSFLNNLIKTYKDNGATLEARFLPDFSRMHPNQLITDTHCYPGKQIYVVSVTAQKPVEWKYKITQGDFVFPRHDLGVELDSGGHKYFVDLLGAVFASDVPNSEYCLRILAYDAKNIDLPVYTYIFSR